MKRGLFIFNIMILSLVVMLLPNILVQAQTSQDEIQALGWNPDGTLLALAGVFADQPGVQLRDNLNQIVQFFPTSAKTLSVSWSPTGSFLATHVGDEERLTIIWDINSTNIVTSFKEIGSKNDHFVHWNPNIGSNQFATEETGFVHIRNAMTGDILGTIRSIAIINSISTFTWNQTGTQLLTIGDDGFVRAWDTMALQMLREVQIDDITDIALSPDGNQLAVSSRFDSVSILNTNTFEIHQVLQGIPGEDSFLYAVRWHPDGSRVAASGFDKITIWNLSTGNIVNTLPFMLPPRDVIPWAMDYHPNGQLTYIGPDNNIIIQPTADAGPDQIVTDSDGNGSEDVELKAELSFDPDGTIVSYEWFEGGNLIATGVNPMVNLAVGVHVITLTVTDDDGATGGDAVVITVEPQDRDDSP